MTSNRRDEAADIRDLASHDRAMTADDRDAVAAEPDEARRARRQL
jgi:hypothetical protein